MGFRLGAAAQILEQLIHWVGRLATKSLLFGTTYWRNNFGLIPLLDHALGGGIYQEWEEEN